MLHDMCRRLLPDGKLFEGEEYGLSIILASLLLIIMVSSQHFWQNKSTFSLQTFGIFLTAEFFQLKSFDFVE